MTIAMLLGAGFIVGLNNNQREREEMPEGRGAKRLQRLHREGIRQRGEKNEKGAGKTSGA